MTAAIRTTTLKIAAGVLVAMIPALLSYCQAVYETKSKYAQSHAEAEAGYSELAKAVTQLQASVQDQHDQMVRLQAYVNALEYMRTPLPTGLTPFIRKPVEQMKTIMADAVRPDPVPEPALDRPAATLNSAIKDVKGL